MAIKGMVEIEDVSVCWDTQGVPEGMVFVRATDRAPGRPDSEAAHASAVLDLGQFLNVMTLALSDSGVGTSKGTAWDDAKQVTEALGGIRICP